MPRRKTEAAMKKAEELVKLRRHQIFEAAARVFGRKGYHNATMREIAEEADLGKGTLYEYVKSKKELLFLVADESNSLLFAEWEKLKEKDMPAEEKFREAIRVELHVIDQYSEAARALIPELLGLEATEAERMEHMKIEYVNKFKHFYDECVEAGVLKDVGTFATCELIGTCVMQWGKSDTLKKACNNSVEDFEALMLDVFFSGIKK